MQLWHVWLLTRLLDLTQWEWEWPGNTRKKKDKNEKLILYSFWKPLVKKKGGGGVAASVPHPLTVERRQTDSEETQHKASETIKTRAAAPRNNVMCKHQEQKRLVRVSHFKCFKHVHIYNVFVCVTRACVLKKKKKRQCEWACECVVGVFASLENLSK